MAATNWDVHQWDQTNATKKNTSAVNRPVFVYQLLGIVMAPTIAMIILTKRNVVQSHVQPISTNVTTRNVYSKVIIIFKISFFSN